MKNPLAMAALGAALLATSVSPALAGLGGNEASISADLAKLNGQLSITTGAGFTVHEIQLPSGTIVREYLSTAGTVFAITWRGPVIPDLKQTLGTYYPLFRTVVNSTPTGADHRHLAVDQAQLVVRSHGHMRSHHGVVYVPQLVPPDVSLSDIQ